MLQQEEFAALNYDDKKGYIIDILTDMPEKFTISKTILKLVQNHSPSDSFLMSTFNQLVVMENEGAVVLSEHQQESIAQLDHITEQFDQLSDKEKEEAETNLIENLENI